MRALAALLGAASLLAPVDPAPFRIARDELERALERELALRAWAHAPAAHASALGAALASSDWVERAAALEALERAQALAIALPDGLVESARGCLADPQPNVRARALRLAAELGSTCAGEPPSGAATLPELAQAELYAAVLPCLRAGEVERLRWLVERSRTSAPAGELARALLAAAGPSYAGLQGAWLAPAGGTLALRELLESWSELVQASIGPELVSALRRGAVGARPGERALIEWLVLQQSGFQATPAAAYDRELLVRGWLDHGTGAAERDTDHEARRYAFLHELPVGRDPRLAAAFFEAARELSQWQTRRSWAWPRIFRALAGLRRLRWPPPLVFLVHWPALALDLELPARATAAPGSARLTQHALDALRWYATPADAVRDLLQSASEMDEPSVALERALVLAPEEAEVVWQTLLGRGTPWNTAELEPWLSRELAAELREGMVRFLAHEYVLNHRPAVRAALERLLEDPEPVIAAEAFRALVDGPTLPEAALHSAWLALPRSERIERLRELPAGAPLASFRSDLLALGEDPEARVPPLLELLGAFAGDSEVGARLADWLERSRRAPAGDRERVIARIWQEKDLVETLLRVDPAGHVELLEQLLAEAQAGLDGGGRDALTGLELVKACARALGRSALGRVRLAHWLTAEQHTRLRVEAALQILGAEDRGEREQPAREALLAAWSSCDSELRDRILSAFGGLADSASLAVLEQVALGEARALENGLSAVTALARRGGYGALERVVDEAVSEDVALAAVRALAAAEEEGGRASLARLARSYLPAFRVAAPRALEDRAARVGGELLLGLARRDALPEAELGLLWLHPLQSAAADLAARFHERSLPDVEFSWTTELGLAAELARGGRIARALALEPRWLELDARCLAALAQHVGQAAAELRAPAERRDAFAAALELARGAGAALAGEPLSPDSVQLGARLARLRLDWLEEVGDWEGLEACASALEWELLLGGTRGHALEHALGGRDPRRGRDPAARLRSAAAQARAGAALARGDRAGALQHLREAAPLLGSSREAEAFQRRLEARLAP